VSITELAQLVRDLIAPCKTVKLLNNTASSNARNIYVPNISKARSKLGLEVTISLTDSIVRAAEKHRILHSPPKKIGNI